VRNSYTSAIHATLASCASSYRVPVGFTCATKCVTFFSFRSSTLRMKISVGVRAGLSSSLSTKFLALTAPGLAGWMQSKEAEKSSTCTCGGAPAARFTLAAFLMVSTSLWKETTMSSASSTVKMRSADRSMSLFLMSSSSLPGVATSRCCVTRSYRRPPMITLEVMPAGLSGDCTRKRPTFFRRSSVCMASSRVGERHSACGAATFGSITSSMAKPKAPVLPLPALDCAIMLGRDLHTPAVAAGG